ncbi:Protein CBG19225 [Caenorhabditis briggsae]|uniref:N-acetylgalactosaminide beta-1,3-galactosyltransferase n=1 Tax=Caenorhabditis briggsae TaxID=6238 RepID=A8XV45_CAEBR|nr:Protein CBG19225 [Caenorhabditis briggsae]CAP36512.2 Protein CBG19225 [Caenorhabditis briggsae]
MGSERMDRLDLFAFYTLLAIILIHIIIFPHHKRFLIPADLTAHYPESIRPFYEHIARTRNLKKLIRGIENSEPIFSLPSSGQIFCFVETSEKHYSDRVPSIASTWLGRCDNGRFFSKTPLPDAKMPFSTVYRNLEDDYDDLFRKTLFGFYYSYTYISKDFDWYLKGDDDSYYAMDHLKEYLSTLDPMEPLYLGYRMKPFLVNKLNKKAPKDGYNSGGPGYILSNAAVRIFAEHLYHDEVLCPYDWAEDRGMARCLASMGIYPADTRDENGLHRFIPFRVNEWREVPDAYNYYPLMKNGSLVSEKFVSIHQLSPKKMILLDSILYPSSGKRLFTPEFLNLL